MSEGSATEGTATEGTATERQAELHAVFIARPPKEARCYSLPIYSGTDNPRGHPDRAPRPQRSPYTGTTRPKGGHPPEARPPARRQAPLQPPTRWRGARSGATAPASDAGGAASALLASPDTSVPRSAITHRGTRRWGVLSVTMRRPTGSLLARVIVRCARQPYELGVASREDARARRGVVHVANASAQQPRRNGRLFPRATRPHSSLSP
jgi:hypothetical protein